MDFFFLDTSALVKRYVKEIGSSWVTAICDPQYGNALYLAQITQVEMTSAVARRCKFGSLTSTQAGIIQNNFQDHLVNEYTEVQLTTIVLSLAIRMADIHSLRALDAVQLASLVRVNSERKAKNLPPLILVSADDELNAAAISEGISVENPNSHP